jgi:ubiquinone/menaquinone biosynthesis C-methylase UbiE
LNAPSPAIVFETLNAYQRSNALRGAIELDLFTAIGEGSTSVASIAARIQASEKGARVLCDLLTVIGFLTKQDGEYSLSPDSAAFLNRHSPAYIGASAAFLGDPRVTSGFDDIAAVVRRGGTLTREGGEVEANGELWIEFARSMATLMAMPAELLAKAIGADAAQQWKVLDIAAGHGMFGIAIAKHSPDAQVVAVDWAPVLSVAQENAAKHGVASRFSIIPGSALEVDLGSGYDVVVIANFLQLLDVPAIANLLGKIWTALAPAGRVVTLGFIPNQDRVSPPGDAAFGLIALAMTAGGDAYTFAEYERMFREAGFARSELDQLRPSPQRIVVSYK